MANTPPPTSSNSSFNPVEPEIYPGTNTFVNLLNIEDTSKLLKAEASLTNMRSLELLQQPEIIPQTFDVGHLQNIHQHLFQDIFEWAGCFRAYDVKKGEDIFTPADKLEEMSSQVFTEIITDGCFHGVADPDELANKSARYLGRINALHPFPEGNGRAQRIFLSHLFKKTPYDLRWDLVPKWEMILVCQNVHRLPPEERFDSMEWMMRKIMVNEAEKQGKSGVPTAPQQ